MSLIMVSTMLDKLGKQGILKPDADGYRWVNFGAFAASNESGVYYDGPSGVNAVNNGTILRRKLSKGALAGEADHPSIAGLTTEQAIARMADISTANKSHGIRNLRLIADRYVCPKTGSKAIICEGNVIPVDNTLGEKLEKDFQDAFQNTSFSIRCFLDRVRSTYNVRFISEIVTWDWVTEPGILCANKWMSAACEGIQPLMGTKELLSMEVTNDDLYNAIEELRTQGGTESSSEVIAFLSAVNSVHHHQRPVFLR